jgi:tetraacyldisaccharide 4'-kinase
MDIRLFVYRVMTDRQSGTAAWVLKFFLSPAAVVYGFCIFILNKLYDKGLKRQYEVPLPVISVGNLTVGGTGKTPFTLFVAKFYEERGAAPAILTRGYGNDENVMFSHEMPGVPVYKGADRVHSAEKASKEGCSVIVMDDAFQHRRIKRDLDIVLIDSCLFFGNGKLLPRGILRERVANLKRADILLLTKVDAVADDEKDDKIRFLRRSFPGVPVAESIHRPRSLTAFSGDISPPSFLRGKNVLLVSAIADPGYFRKKAEDLGANGIFEIIYADHYGYTQEDVDYIYSAALRYKADMILTTGKDMAKLRRLSISALNAILFVVDIEIEIISGKEDLFAGLNSCVSNKIA